MAYIQPITDRSISDIIEHTAKGHFGVNDWERITENTAEAKALVESIRSRIIAQNSLINPGMSTIPSADNINALVDNIIAVRTAAEVPAADTYQLKSDYIGGATQAAPDYQTVNAWEKVIDIIVRYFENLHKDRYPITGLACCGAGMTQQNGFRR